MKFDEWFWEMLTTRNVKLISKLGLQSYMALIKMHTEKKGKSIWRWMFVLALPGLSHQAQRIFVGHVLESWACIGYSWYLSNSLIANFMNINRVGLSDERVWPIMMILEVPFFFLAWLRWEIIEKIIVKHHICFYLEIVLEFRQWTCISVVLSLVRQMIRRF